MTSAAAWIQQRLVDAPPELLATMLRALPHGEGPVPQALARGALALYREVIRGSGGREDALPLLAADGLFTHAFEAQAELDIAGLADFAERWGGRHALAEVEP